MSEPIPLGRYLVSGYLVGSIQNGELIEGKEKQSHSPTTWDRAFWLNLGNSHVFNSKWHKSWQTCVGWYIFARFAMMGNLNTLSKFKHTSPPAGIDDSVPAVLCPVSPGAIFVHWKFRAVCLNPEVTFLWLPSFSVIGYFPLLHPLLVVISVLSNNSVTLSLTLNSCISF